MASGTHVHAHGTQALSLFPHVCGCVAHTFVCATRDLPPTPSSTPLPLSFAMNSHEGSVRGVAIAPSSDGNPPLMFSIGSDNALRLYDLDLSLEIGETRLPADLNGIPTVGTFVGAKHICVGTTVGKLVLFDVATLSVVHIMGGHTATIDSLTSHPSGAMILSSCVADGTIRLWDMTKGRCSFVNRIKSTKSGPSLVTFSPNGNAFTYIYDETHVTTQDSASGEILLDVDLMEPQLRVNAICYTGPLNDERSSDYVALGLNNGGMCLMKLKTAGDESEDVMATMVLEGGEGVKCGGDRIKAMARLEGGSGFVVATTTSEGVVSVWDCEGGAHGMMQEDEDSDSDSEEEAGGDDDEEEEEGAALLQRVKLGQGSRITTIAAWSAEEGIDYSLEGEAEEAAAEEAAEAEAEAEARGKKKRGAVDATNIEKDAEPVKKAKYIGKNGKEYATPRKGYKLGLGNGGLDQNGVMGDEKALAAARSLIEKSKKEKKKRDKKAKSKK